MKLENQYGLWQVAHVSEIFEILQLIKTKPKSINSIIKTISTPFLITTARQSILFPIKHLNSKRRSILKLTLGIHFLFIKFPSNRDFFFLSRLNSNLLEKVLKSLLIMLQHLIGLKSKSISLKA